MIIINLTQHTATPEQVAAGVIEFAPYERYLLLSYLTFDEIPSREFLEARADMIARLAIDSLIPGCGDDTPTHAMIGGAPFLMAPLEVALREVGISPLYAFSVRESVEVRMDDGAVRKTNVFRHAGFVG